MRKKTRAFIVLYRRGVEDNGPNLFGGVLEVPVHQTVTLPEEHTKKEGLIGPRGCYAVPLQKKRLIEERQQETHIRKKKRSRTNA